MFKNPCHGVLEFQIFPSAIIPVLFLVPPQPAPSALGIVGSLLIVVSDSLAIPWTEACQASLSMKFPRPEY